MNIIGLVGPFGSGCSYVGKIITESSGYEYLSLSIILRELYEDRGNGRKYDRENLQDFGNELRRLKGSDYLARTLWEKITHNQSKNYIIDSFRNPEEVKFFRDNSSNFYLFGIFADEDIRWNRSKSKYNDNHGNFSRDDARDSYEREQHGQRVTETFKLSDVIILNNKDFNEGNQEHKIFSKNIKDKVDIIEKRIPFRPTDIETNMAMTYALSLRSSCLKRKVGAIVVDDSGNVFSTGYNEVPITQKSCLHEYNECYRDKLKREFHDKLDNILDEEKKREVFDEFQSKFKILDYCRALHAEENLILNFARVGASSLISNSILYTTTYPCNLCANKISKVEISELVFFEPYPMKEAKNILSKRNIKQTPFEGVTYNGYFRFMEEDTK